MARRTSTVTSADVFGLYWHLAGIQHHRFHDLGHTTTTILHAAGVSPKAIQYFMGWKDSRMVDRYTHPVAKVMNETGLAMEQALSLPKADRKQSDEAGWKN